MAADHGFWGLSITDHDSLEAFDEASGHAAARSVVLFPGVEISAQFQGESIHVLGYCFDPKSPILQDMCRRHREWRDERNELMIQKLTALGMPLSMEEVKRLSPEAVACGRPHIAIAMVHHGYVRSIKAAFQQFLGSGRSCYAPGKKSTVAEAIDAIHAAGGLAVLAHPQLMKKTFPIEELLSLSFVVLRICQPFVIWIVRFRCQFRGGYILFGFIVLSCNIFQSVITLSGDPLFCGVRSGCLLRARSL